MFDPAEQLAIREHADFITAHRDRASDTVALASGRVVQVSGTRIVSGGEIAGVVVVAQVVAEPAQSCATGAGARFADEVLPSAAVAEPRTRTLAGGLSRPHAPIASGSSPAWLRACEELPTRSPGRHRPS